MVFGVDFVVGMMVVCVWVLVGCFAFVVYCWCFCFGWFMSVLLSWYVIDYVWFVLDVC